ncbi:MAG: 2-phospho-L-lactate transferase [Anaerolineaceae bacterium]
MKGPTELKKLKVVALAGGVGGAKLAVGLDHVLEPGNLTVIVNTGDDFEHFGLTICPDLDTVCYSLAGKADSLHGWGLEDESWQVAASLKELKAPTWFQLGDRDLATHLERTRLLRIGWSLSKVTQHFCRMWGIRSWVLPMSNQPFRTMIRTKQGELLSFQEYFVKDHFEPEIDKIIFEKAADCEPEPSILERILNADLVVFCPSNPWVSLDPILSLPGVREAIRKKTAIAVSPIIKGKTVKGPASKMFFELGIEPSSRSVMEHYQDVLDGFIFDDQDAILFQNEADARIIKLSTNTLMKNVEDKINLANQVLIFGSSLIVQARNHDDVGRCSS